MSGGIFGFDNAIGIGGSSTKTDRGNFLTGVHDLSNVFNFGMTAGKNALSEGESRLSTAGDYFDKLLKGNRSALIQAKAPEINAAEDRSDASRRNLAASGTARGGGVAGTNQTAKDRTMAEIDNMLFGVRGEAAKGEAAVGGVQAQIGEELAQLGTNAAATFTDESNKSRKTSLDAKQQAASNAGQAMFAIMGAFV